MVSILDDGIHHNFKANLKQVNFVLSPPGIQHNHPDLAQNYDPFASTDINDSDQDPMPQVLRNVVVKEDFKTFSGQRGQQARDEVCRGGGSCC